VSLGAVSRDEHAEIHQLARRETRRVRVWRRNVFLVLAGAAALVTTLTYLFLRNQEEKIFSSAFHQFALTIRDSTRFNLSGVLQALAGLGQVCTAQVFPAAASSSAATPTTAVDGTTSVDIVDPAVAGSGVQWPLVTLANFEVTVSYTRAQASSELVVVCPLVDKNKNTYSTQHQGWIRESFNTLEKAQPDLDPIPSSIYRFGRLKGPTILMAEDGSDDLPMAPFWQMSPPPFETSIVNYNALSLPEYRENYQTMLQTRSFVVGRAQLNFLIGYAISQADHDALHDAAENHSNTIGDAGGDTAKHNNDTQKKVGFANDHPHSSIIYPVFARAKDVNSTIVAIVVAVLPWDAYFENLLPDGVDGIYCILKNSCGQEFTYVLNGNDVVYLGEGTCTTRNMTGTSSPSRSMTFWEGRLPRPTAPKRVAPILFSFTRQLSWKANISTICP
jgi:hypothetical protein